MKRVISAALLLGVSLAFSACSDTNDRGVIIDRPFSLFGSNVDLNTTAPAATPVAASSAPVVADSRS